MEKKSAAEKNYVFPCTKRRKAIQIDLPMLEQNKNILSLYFTI
jgi:hypothetical protein